MLVQKKFPEPRWAYIRNHKCFENMAVLTGRLPDDVLHTIVEYCDPLTLPALARTNKQISKIALKRLYRNIYFHHIGSRARNGLATRWSCALCGCRMTDEIFNDRDVQPQSTRCRDIYKLASVLAGSQDRRDLVQTLRLDIQSPTGWDKNDDSYFDDPPSSTEPGSWFPSKKLKRTLDTIADALSHLSLSRALLTSSCFDEHETPRLIQTMGMPLPCVLVLPHYAIDGKRIYKRDSTLSSHPTASEIWNIETALEYDGAQIDHTSWPPQVVRMQGQNVRETGILALRHYIGPCEDLEKLLKAPHKPEQYRQWLIEKPKHDCEGNEIKSVVLRNQRRHFEFLDERYPRLQAEIVGSQVLGDSEFLKTVYSASRTTGEARMTSLPSSILLKDLQVRLLEGQEIDPALLKLQKMLGLAT